MRKVRQADFMAIAMEKQDLISEFLRLTQVQAEQINADNYDSILQIINQKQSIIEQVNGLDLDTQGIAGGEDQQAQEVQAATHVLLTQTLELESQNIAAIKLNQAQIFAKLKNAQLNQATHSAYRGQHIALEGTLVDKKK